MRRRLRKLGRMAMLGGVTALAAAPQARGLERLTLADGATFDCVRHEAVGDYVRVYTSDDSYIQLKAEKIVSIDVLPEPVAPAKTVLAAATVKAGPLAGPLTPADMAEMLSSAGRQHNIDADLLASIVKAESGGQAHAVSRTGAQGLMQLMPGTAREMGVSDSFEPRQNINGGTEYLDELLTRYHDNLSLAVAAYNAGPAAVDRYHGIPPYRETQAYVARVVHEFNKRKLAAKKAEADSSAALRNDKKMDSPQPGKDLLAKNDR